VGVTVSVLVGCRPAARESELRANKTTSAEDGTPALDAATPTISNSSLAVRAAASEARSFSDAATIAMRVIVAREGYAAR
jgi:hypothetical protein